ncbi:MAG: hypothetical protein INF12_14765 [Methylobacterium sp.]|nr:hypothetical protein [Methylobacterium sp.]
MTVTVFPGNRLTPQQVLAMCLNDKLEEIEAVVVARITKGGAKILVSWSHMPASKLAWVGAIVTHAATEETLRGT